MGSKKEKNKGKLDRSAAVTIGGTAYNVHPKVKQTMDGMYREYMHIARTMNELHPFEEKERALLNKIVTVCEPLQNLPPEMVGFIQDIKDLMKTIAKEEPNAEGQTVQGPAEAPGASTQAV